MKLEELRQLSESELNHRIGELRQEIYNLVFQKAARQTPVTKRPSILRREIAQIHTILREHELGIHPMDRPSSAMAQHEDSGE